MNQDQGSDEPKQESQAAASSVGQPTVRLGAIPKQAETKPTEQRAQDGAEPTKPLFLQVAGGDELKPFEKQTLAISKETLEISRRTFWVAVLAFFAAAAAAIFVYSQVKVMSYQTQIMASQVESDAAGGSLSAVQVQQQLRIAQQQAQSAQEAVTLQRKESDRNAIRIEKQLTILEDQVKATRDQADAALKSALAIQRQTEISERPWLSIEPKPIWLNYVDYPTGKQAVLVVRFSIKNIGKSVAKAIQIDAKMFPADPSIPVSLEAAKNQRDICEHPTSRQIGAFDLFPTEQPAEMELDIAAVPSAVTAKALAHRDDQSRKFVGFYFVGCASYHYSFGAELHQTFFAYHLVGPARFDADHRPLILSNGMPVMGAFEVGINVQKEQLGLMQELLARNDAY